MFRVKNIQTFQKVIVVDTVALLFFFFFLSYPINVYLGWGPTLPVTVW